MNRVYANAFFVAMGLTDARVIFRVDEPIVDYEKMQITSEDKEEVATVCLSLQSAKLLSQALSVAIAGHEARFGEIPLPGGPEVINGATDEQE